MAAALSTGHGPAGELAPADPEALSLPRLPSRPQGRVPRILQGLVHAPLPPGRPPTPPCLGRAIVLWAALSPGAALGLSSTWSFLCLPPFRAPSVFPKHRPSQCPGTGAGRASEPGQPLGSPRPPASQFSNVHATLASPQRPKEAPARGSGAAGMDTRGCQVSGPGAPQGQGHGELRAQLTGGKCSLGHREARISRAHRA